MHAVWKKRHIFPVLLAFLLFLFLVSCRGRVAGGEQPVDTATALKMVQTGTQGVELTLIQDAPPPIVYDQNELIALVEVQNRGNHHLEAADCFVQLSNFDPNIILGGMEVPRSCAENIGTLEGKTVYNLYGGNNQLEFSSSSIQLPPGVPEYSPNLLYKVCYQYETVASPSVCIDPLFYQVSREQKACIPQNVALGGGQGGPVGASYVGVNMVGGRAVFEINVRNLGSGRVVSPFADIRACDVGLERTDLDKVGYTVKMSGTALPDCKPQDGMVRLVNNQGKIVCTVDVPGSAAYETPLVIDLTYGYIQSYTKPLKIVKTPQ